MKKLFVTIVGVLLLVNFLFAQQRSAVDHFRNPPASAKPWVIWYWMHGAFSRAGITADLEAMKAAGIGGAYLMPIKDTVTPPIFQPAARQLSPEWWQLVHFAMQEAKRLDLQLGMHLSDGFSLAGGPWITPELSMQKLVWSKQFVKADFKGTIQLSKPEAIKGYYKDVATYAYPVRQRDWELQFAQPEVTTSNNVNASFLTKADSKESFRGDNGTWIQYTYPQPVTVRSLRIKTGSNNYQSHRLIVQVSNDGKNFTTLTRLSPPRHGWQDTDEDVTYALPETTSKYFRFVYDKEGTEPGAEDLDAAKWKPSLKLMQLILSGEAVINQFESKNGSMWRVSLPATQQTVPASTTIPLDKIIDLTASLDKEGKVNFTGGQLPAGYDAWVIVRMGHTSTGHENATAGAGKGLECDKFNPEAITLQFNSWFGQAFAETDPQLAGEVLKLFHMDSWEAGSQNWSKDFAKQFHERRGYAIQPWLLAMTGVPLRDAISSEKFLHDVRQTIAEMLHDVFYGTIKGLVREKGCTWSAETVAPTMMSDGLLHYSQVDIPMGEFWLNSPTHDKPNDMLDAISAAHIYGKKIIQAEAFTTLRMNWSEHPGMLKALGDRNFALGMNKMVIHVFVHNPWMDRRPGMTLDGVGLYYQRDQTWFKPGYAWMEYLTRCHALLQLGDPVADIAVFTGEELPRRSLLPDRLVNTLPDIYGPAIVQKEKERLANKNQPTRVIPDGVTHSANMADPEKWIDPLGGYAYDSFNPDALLKATVKNGRVVFPGGMSYRILVLPTHHQLQPAPNLMSVPVAKKLLELLQQGATIIMGKSYDQTNSLNDEADTLRNILQKIYKGSYRGKLVGAPYASPDFRQYGLMRDLQVIGAQRQLAWTHRRTDKEDIYFISNQAEKAGTYLISLREKGTAVLIADPVSGKVYQEKAWKLTGGRTQLSVKLDKDQSLFVIVTKQKSTEKPAANFRTLSAKKLSAAWNVQFDPENGGPVNPVVFDKLSSWSQHADSAIRFYSGTAVYKNSFNWTAADAGKKIWLELDSVANIASVRVNGQECGILWTRPYRLDLTAAVHTGKNTIEISVTNTWANRLIGDQALPEEKRITRTTAPFRLKDKPLLPAGLLGEVKLVLTNAK
jgi:hypothetical protein